MLDIEKSILVVIDVQGNLAQSMHDKNAFIQNLKILIEGAKILDLPIIWVEQIPEKLGETLPEIAALMQDSKPISKTSFSVFGNQEVREKLHGFNRSQILLSGIESHVCVYQSCRDLIANDYEVHLIGDAIASRTEANKQIGLKRGEGLGANISSAEMALFDLVGSPEHPRFGELIKILK